MWRSYNTEHFKKFALKLKKEHLWNRFFILEYYFKFYQNPNNTSNRLIEYYKNEDDKEIISKDILEYRYCRGTYFDGTNEDVKLSDFFKHYRI